VALGDTTAHRPAPGSQTETPQRQDLFSGWDGRKPTDLLDGGWLHTGRDWTWRATARLRRGVPRRRGFVTQTGIRLGRYALYRNYPKTGLFRRVQPFGIVRYIDDRHGTLVQQQTNAGVQLMGARNLFRPSAGGPGAAAGRAAPQRTHLPVDFQIDPSRRFSRIGGFDPPADFNAPREGRRVFLFGTIKPPTTWRSTDRGPVDRPR
jgi:hypothetical protein